MISQIRSTISLVVAFGTATSVATNLHVFEVKCYNGTKLDMVRTQKELLAMAGKVDGVSDWAMASVYDLATRIGPFQASANWSRSTVETFLESATDETRKYVEGGIGVVCSRRTANSVAESLGFDPLPEKDSVLDEIHPLELLDSATWTASSDLAQSFNEDTLRNFRNEIEKRKRVADANLKRRAWGGESAKAHPSDTDNEYIDALGEHWLRDDDVVAIWNGTWIDVIVGDITREEFMEKYAKPSIPVVLRGSKFGGFGADPDAMKKWSWSHFHDAYGDINHEIKWSSRHQDQDCEIGMLCPVGEISMKSLIEDYVWKDEWQEELRAMGEDMPDTVPYLRDLSLETFFPDLHAEVKFSSLFWENSYDVVTSRWPTAFVGPAGSRSELHRDTAGASFTMTPILGRKTFALFAPEDTPFTMRCKAKEPIINVFNPDFETCPEAKKATLYYSTLYPGDTLYVPQQWLHSIRNPDATVGITRNFLSQNELESAEDFLRERSGVEWFLDDEDETDEERANRYYEQIDFHLCSVWETLILLSDSEAYNKRRDAFLGNTASQIKNHYDIMDLNRQWMEEAYNEDPDLGEALWSGLPIFSLETFAGLFEYLNVDPASYDQASAEAEYAHQLLRDNKAADQFFYNDASEEEKDKVRDFVHDQKMKFAFSFADRALEYWQWEEDEWDEEEQWDGDELNNGKNDEGEEDRENGEDVAIEEERHLDVDTCPNGNPPSPSVDVGQKPKSRKFS